MVDCKIGHFIGLAQTDVDRDTTAAIFFEPQPTPTNNASALRAEVDFQRRVGFTGPRVSAGSALNPNALILIIICP